MRVWHHHVASRSSDSPRLRSQAAWNPPEPGRRSYKSAHLLYRFGPLGLLLRRSETGLAHSARPATCEIQELRFTFLGLQHRVAAQRAKLSVTSLTREQDGQGKQGEPVSPHPVCALAGQNILPILPILGLPSTISGLVVPTKAELPYKVRPRQ